MSNRTNAPSPNTASPAAAIARRIMDRCEAYHVDQLSYEAFTAGQRADWKEAASSPQRLAAVRKLVRAAIGGAK